MSQEIFVPILSTALFELSTGDASLQETCIEVGLKDPLVCLPGHSKMNVLYNVAQAIPRQALQKLLKFSQICTAL